MLVNQQTTLAKFSSSISQQPRAFTHHPQGAACCNFKCWVLCVYANLSSRRLQGNNEVRPRKPASTLPCAPPTACSTHPIPPPPRRTGSAPLWRCASLASLRIPPPLPLPTPSAWPCETATQIYSSRKLSPQLLPIESARTTKSALLISSKPGSSLRGVTRSASP